MRNRLGTRRELLKALLTMSGTAMLPRTGFPSGALARLDSENKSTIKVVGVGGAGAHVVELMIREGLQGVEFICIDADTQQLLSSSARTRILLGHGSGTTGRPEIACELAIAARSRIAGMLQGADMVFVVAGFGRGTGSGAAPVVGEVARELGILTIGVVTNPFQFEGGCMDVAMSSANELNRFADALIIVPIDRVAASFGDETSVGDVLHLVDRLISYAIRGLVDNVKLAGMINLDHDDLKSVMTEAGLCATSSATARGDDRARIATMRALYSPPMTVLHLPWRRFILFNVTSCPRMRPREVAEVFRTLRKNYSGVATILGGAVVDPGMKDSLRVTLIAGGRRESTLPVFRI